MNNKTIQRITAGIIATIAFAVLLLRVYLATIDLGSVTAALVHLSQFFTILTNLAVGILMFLLAIKKPVKPIIVDALVVAIVGVCLVYHAVLSQLWSPQGLAWWADQGVHTMVPVLTLLWWLTYSQAGGSRWRDLPKLIIWPLVYCLYALIRAQFSDFYPYPFLNLTELGLTQLVINVAGLCVLFMLLGAIIFGLKRLVKKWFR